MNEQTRYRLTGAIFLLSIGIIVLPMVFDGQGVRVKQLPELSEPLPPMPTDAELEALEIPRAEVEQHRAEQELTGGLLDKDGFNVADGTRIGDPLLIEPEPAPDPTSETKAGNDAARLAEKSADAEPVMSAVTESSGSIARTVPQPSSRNEAPARRAPPVAAKAPAKGKPAIWAVQLASFASPVNASALRDRLLGDGFEAWTSTARAASGVRTRVAIGPLLDRDDAQRMRDLVSGRYNVSAIVVHMEP